MSPFSSQLDLAFQLLNPAVATEESTRQSWLPLFRDSNDAF